MASEEFETIDKAKGDLFNVKIYILSLVGIFISNGSASNSINARKPSIFEDKTLFSLNYSLNGQVYNP